MMLDPDILAKKVLNKEYMMGEGWWVVRGEKKQGKAERQRGNKQGKGVASFLNIS